MYPFFSSGVKRDKHHPAPGGLEVSRTTLPAHGLVWLGTTRMALGPAAAADPSYVWQHVDAVLNAATPSIEECVSAACSIMLFICSVWCQWRAVC